MNILLDMETKDRLQSGRGNALLVSGSIYQACRKLISDPAHKTALEAKIAQTSLRNWDDVASDFVRHLDPD